MKTRYSVRGLFTSCTELSMLNVYNLFSNSVYKFVRDFTCVSTGVVDVTGKTTLAGGGFIPSIINSFVTRDCRKRGKLFLRNPIRHGWGDAFNNLSSLSQNSSGSTLVSINSCIKVRTCRSTALGSRLDNSNKFAKNLRHFSLVLAVVWR